MLDLDVDSFFLADMEPHNAYLQLFRQYAWTEREIIVNIVGQPKNADLQAMADRLQQYGIEIALNAAGLHRSMPPSFNSTAATWIERQGRQDSRLKP